MYYIVYNTQFPKDWTNYGYSNAKFRIKKDKNLSVGTEIRYENVKKYLWCQVKNIYNFSIVIASSDIRTRPNLVFGKRTKPEHLTQNNKTNVVCKPCLFWWIEIRGKGPHLNFESEYRELKTSHYTSTDSVLFCAKSELFNIFSDNREGTTFNCFAYCTPNLFPHVTWPLFHPIIGNLEFGFLWKCRQTSN